MSKPAIRVSELSKKYLLSHQKERFPTLRESAINALRGAANTVLHPFAARDAARKSMDVFWALKDISFEIASGERVGIVGRNGAGKSTLLKVLSRITPPTSGRVEINGRVASLLEVGTGFHPDLTGRENIFLNGAVLGMSRAEIRSKFDEIVAFAEVDRFLDTPVKRYSSGMYVRLAFAVAAHLTPEILLVDEVLAVGDAEFQKKCLGLMQDVSTTQGRTVFFVSHNMAAVQALCTTGIYLRHGQLLHAGPVQEVVDLYVAKGESGALNASPVLGKDFELLNVKLATPEGTPLATFRPAVIEIQYRALSNMIDAGAHIIFDDLNGSPILGLETKDFIEKVAAKAGQTVTCTFRIQSLPLNPGPFRLRLWLRSHSDHIHWEVPVSYDVSVEETLVYGVRRIDRLIHGAAGAKAVAEVRADGGQQGH